MWKAPLCSRAKNDLPTDNQMTVGAVPGPEPAMANGRRPVARRSFIWLSEYPLKSRFEELTAAIGGCGPLEGGSSPVLAVHDDR